MPVPQRPVVLGLGTLRGPECISTLFCGCGRTGKCPRGAEVNTVKGAPLLTGHTCRHPSTCRALCHTSQQPADGFILSPALSPLLFYVTFLPASCLHLSSICYVLLSVSCSFGVVSHSCFTFSRQWCFGCFIGIFDNQGRECSLFFFLFLKKSRYLLLMQGTHLLQTFNCSAHFCCHSDAKNSNQFERLKSL